MAKRFTATEIWDEDWFLSMPNEYKLFWFYMLSNCDHAGLFKVNYRSFSGLVGVNLASSNALNYFNTGKQRVRIIKDSLWLIEDFFVYQYGPKINPKNRLHQSVIDLYAKHKIELTSIRGLVDLNNYSTTPHLEDMQGVKDKDKDKDKDTVLKEGVLGEVNTWNFMPGEKEMNIALPEIKAGAATEMYYYTNQKRLTTLEIESLWNIFKTQNFTGSKPYPTIQETYSHFINWIKTQKINGTDVNGVGQNSKSASAHKLANRVAGSIPNKQG